MIIIYNIEENFATSIIKSNTVLFPTRKAGLKSFHTYPRRDPPATPTRVINDQKTKYITHLLSGPPPDSSRSTNR